MNTHDRAFLARAAILDHRCKGAGVSFAASVMADTKSLMDALHHLSRDATLDEASRIVGAKRAIEHFLEQAGANRLERWRLLLELDDDVATMGQTDQFFLTMRNIITQLLNEMPEQTERRGKDQPEGQ